MIWMDPSAGYRQTGCIGGTSPYSWCCFLLAVLCKRILPVRKGCYVARQHGFLYAMVGAVSPQQSLRRWLIVLLCRLTGLLCFL